MKKKILAVALAATMVVGSAFSAFAATESSVTIDAGFSANSGVETLSGDFNVTYTFHNVSNINTDSNSDSYNTYQNWQNFILEMNNGNGVYIDVRADNYGWTAYTTDGAELTFGDGSADWDAWLETMKSGSDCTVNVVRSGNDFTITTTAAGETFTATVTAADFDGCDVNIYLTGEYCTLTNIVFDDGSADDATTAAPADDATTAAPANDTTTTTTAQSSEETGDVATFATVAIVVAAAAAIVVLKKRVTE